MISSSIAPSSPSEIASGIDPKSAFRTKTVGTRLSVAELEEIEAAAKRSGKSLAEWLREIALMQARERPADTTELVLAELVATRSVLLNLFHASAQATQEGSAIAPETVLKIRDSADAKKHGSARKNARGVPRRKPGWSKAVKKYAVCGLLAMLFFSAGLGPLFEPLLYTMTPLQRYYLGAYLASTLHGNDPSATTDVAWIWKTRKKGKPEFAMEQDLFPKPTLDTLWAGGSLPFLMSEQAQLGGSTGIYKGPSQPVNAAELKSFLREEFFDKTELWRFFLQPALAAGTALLLLLLFHSWRDTRRERNLWRAPKSRWTLARRWILEIPYRVQKPHQQTRLFPSPDASKQLAASMPATVVEAQMVTKPETRPVLNYMPDMATAATVPAKKVAFQDVQSPVPAIAAKPKAVFVWDESKGIE